MQDLLPRKDSFNEQNLVSALNLLLRQASASVLTIHLSEQYTCLHMVIFCHNTYYVSLCLHLVLQILLYNI